MQKSNGSPQHSFSRNLERSTRNRIPISLKTGEDKRETRSGAGEQRSLENFEELFDLCKMSGVKIDRRIYRNIVELVKLNVDPDSILEVIKNVMEIQERKKKGDGTSTSEEAEVEVSLIWRDYIHTLNSRTKNCMVTLHWLFLNTHME